MYFNLQIHCSEPQLHELTLKAFNDEQLASKFLLSAHPSLDGHSIWMMTLTVNSHTSL